LLGGVLVSDALQYHASNLAPTARYEELAWIEGRFAGRGPTLFTDFDEYALYELRDMDVGGPGFVYPPPALAGAAGGHGRPVRLERIAPASLAAYPLIVTRRDPTAVRPPAAYRLLWQGVYYQVWGRRPGVRPALARLAVAAQPTAVLFAAASARPDLAPAVAPPGSSRSRCLQAVKRLALRARARRLLAAIAPQLVMVPVPAARLRRLSGWARVREGILMHRPGTLRLSFRVPEGGAWELWLQGDIMRALRVAVDGRALGSPGGQLGGNSLVANTLSPLPVSLSAGAHTLTITRPGAGLAPGDGGAALLEGVYLTPAGPAGKPSLVSAPAGRWRSLCAHELEWVEYLSSR
ncbi:MAG TPA: hypothetical protein VNX67_07815, partial [Solirubrobacteraceae bacterium]|nr:hypothetical protein [Solirubrobacteraceae bacterium]